MSNTENTTVVDSYKEITRGLNSAVASYTRICEEQQVRILTLETQLRENSSSHERVSALENLLAEARSEISVLRQKLEDKEL